MQKIDRKDILVIILAVLFSILNSLPFFFGLFTTPPGKIYFGTIHYYEDFFFYVNHFFQGSHGAWLVNNRYTPEKTQDSLIYIVNLILGKLWGPAHIRSEIVYNLSLIIFCFLSLIAAYLIYRKIYGHSQKKIASFLFFSLSSSLFTLSFTNHILKINPFTIWRTPQFAFFRLGGIPHNLVQTFAFLMLIYYLIPDGKKMNLKILFVILICSFLSVSVSPVPNIVLLVILFLFKAVSLLNRKTSVPVWKMLAVFIPTILFSLYLQKIYNLPPHSQAKQWELYQQVKYSLPGLILSIGPVLFFSLFGIFSGKNKGYVLFSAAVLAFCYGIASTSIPFRMGILNVRFLFPALYIFWGFLAAEGLEYACGLVQRTGLKIGKLCVYLLFSIFLVLTIPMLYFELDTRVDISRDHESYLIYMDKGLYEGLSKLKDFGKFDDIVLANPESAIDNMIPAISGHTVYSGHMLTTIDSAKKDYSAASVYSQVLKPEDLLQFLRINKIRYIVFTLYDGNIEAFKNKYDFLKTEYSLPGITVFSAG